MSSIRVSEVHSHPLVLWDNCQMLQTERKNRRGKNATLEQLKSTASIASIVCPQRYPSLCLPIRESSLMCLRSPSLFIARAILLGLCCKLYCLCTMNNGGNRVSFFIFYFIFFLLVHVLHRSDGRIRAENRS